MANQFPEISKNNRKIALENGEKTYVSGTPCKKCGSFIKSVKWYSCIDCRREEGLKKLNNSELMASYRTKEKINEKQRLWREKNKDKLKEQNLRRKDKQKIYYEEHKADIREKQLKKTYGITTEEYNNLLEKQNYSCAICGVAECSSGKKFAVDHNHSSGKIRGLLCMKCNRALGLFNDDEKIIMKSIKYLEQCKCESL